MKKIIIKLFVGLSVVLCLSSCEKPEYNTGIKGTVMYGEGDCMPIVYPDNFVLEKFDGTLYFIEKTELDSLGNGDFQKLIDNSFNVEITNGKLDDEVPAGTYTLTIGENYPGIFLGTNHIEIEIPLDDVVRQDFDFRKCITF
tara:strand:- start:1316 stop:1741 length:426 start_codon:yes stop_codon:yes gene_type:complete